MKSFEYGDDNEVSYTEVLFSIPSWIIAVGLLTIPNSVAKATQSSDGWISILAGGLCAIFFCLINIWLGYRFPGQSFAAYASTLVSKPVACFITIAMAVNFLFWVSYETRAMAEIAKLYLFYRTPTEIIALAFLIVVVYAVAGSRAGIFRLHLMFMPIIITIAMVVIVMSIRSIDIDNLMPLWTSDWKDLLEGTKVSIFSFVGFEFILFYIPMLNRVQKPVRLAVIGMGVPVVLYLIFFIVTISVLGLEVTINVPFPSVELAKYNDIQVLGMIFERFESVFFVVWIMAIFGTTIIGLDVSIIGLQSVFPRITKMNWIFLLTPIVFLITFITKNQNEMNTMGEILSYVGVATGGIIPSVLLIVAKVKGSK